MMSRVKQAMRYVLWAIPIVTTAIMATICGMNRRQKWTDILDTESNKTFHETRKHFTDENTFYMQVIHVTYLITILAWMRMSITPLSYIEARKKKKSTPSTNDPAAITIRQSTTVQTA